MTEHLLERALLIRAQRETVFSFFQESERFARWWGEGSSIEPRAGGAVRIVYPDGSVASGNVVELEAPRRIVFTFGYEDPSKPLAPGASTVTIQLREIPEGTRLELRHAFEDQSVRDLHVPGWRFQLALFANAAAALQHASLDALVDRWFEAWSEADAGRRRAMLAEVATADVEFRDAFACVQGLDELVDHIGAAQAHGAGGRIERVGAPRQCQGTAAVDWRVPGPDGEAMMAGTNVLELAADGRIAVVVGLWSPPARA